MKLKSTLLTFAMLASTLVLAQGPELSGTWKAKTVSPRGTAEQTLTLKQTGKTFTGEMTNSQGVKEAVKDGKIDGNDIEFSVERKQQSGDMSLVPYKGKVDGNQITGTFTGASGASVNWTATKEGAESSKSGM